MVDKKLIFKEGLGVMLGGGLGTLARFFVGLGIHIKPFPEFPSAILFINLTGSFLVGVLYALLKEKISGFYKGMLFMGFLGSYTTFSELSFDTNTFILHKYFNEALLNMGLSLLGGLALFGLGYFLSKKIASVYKS